MGDDSDREEPEGGLDDLVPLSTKKSPHLMLSSETLAELGSSEAPDSRPVSPGPKPRSLARARIDVKSDVHGPRVRSGKLRPLRRVRTAPSPLVDLQTPDTISEPPEEAPLSRQGPTERRVRVDSESPPSPSPSSSSGLLAPLQILSILLLFDAALLPAFRARTLVSPLSALMDPATPNFVAAAFLALLGVLFAFRVPLVRRTGVTTAIGGLLVIFSLVLLRSALSSDVFDGQPALRALFGEGVAVVAIVTLAACTLPTGLVWRHAAPESLGARITATFGVVMVLFVYFGLGALNSLGGSPLGLLMAATDTAPFLGDRIAAWLAWVPLLVTGATLLVWLPGRLHGFAGPLAVAAWASVLLPLLVLALFVAPANRWQEALLPVQLASLLAAGTLLLVASLGHLLAFVESGHDA